MTLGAGGDAVSLTGDSAVTLSDAANFAVDAISNDSGQAAITLTLNNGDESVHTLTAGTTSLATASGQSLIVAGTANFNPGLLSDNGFSNLQLIKNGGPGELILDQSNSEAGGLDGALLRVVSGTLSIVGGGGDLSPIATLGQGPQSAGLLIDGAAGKLRLGSTGALATTFANSVLANESGTLEHTSAGTDILGGSLTVATGKSLTANIVAGGLNVNGVLNGPALVKTGGGTLKFTGPSTVNALNVSGGRLEFSGPLQGLSAFPTIAAGATLALTSAATTNPLPGSSITLGPGTGTVELVPGALGAANVPINLNGGTLGLASASPLGYTVTASGSSEVNVAGANSQLAALTFAPSATLTKSGGQLTLSSLILNGAGDYKLSVTGSPLQLSAVTGPATASLTKTGAGTLILSGAQPYATLNALAGVTNVNAAFTEGTATVNANAAVNFSTSQTLAALNIGAGGVVTLNASSAVAEFGAGVVESAVVPEPGTLGLLVLGALGVLARPWRRL